MRVSSGWLKEHLRRTILDGPEIVSALERAGMEVEQVIESTEIDPKVVVGVVKKVIQHPNADRLHLVEITTGESEFRIVCGAPNVREGIKVAVAQIGTVLPGGDRIEKAKLRGEVSEGMLCSELELGIGRNHNGILEISSDIEVGTPLCDIYPADSVIELKTPANRFDVQSVLGLAREVAAMTTAELTPLSSNAMSPSPSGPEVQANADAERYMLALVHVDEANPSPGVMASRLRSAGMRPISPVVDITNYVMLEVGQPLHAFDAAKVKLPISVRSAKIGETLVTLDGVERKLTSDDLIIADQEGPIALAGVMGGLATEVSSETTGILLESAVFDKTVVRKMAKRHTLRSEASGRFERGLPVELPPLAISRAIELLKLHAHGKFISMTDQINSEPEVRSIELHSDRVSTLVGLAASGKEIRAALAELQIESTLETSVGKSDSTTGKTAKNQIANDLVIVPEVPWWRPDLKLPEDLVEEFVRVIGYDKIPSTIPSWRPQRLEFDDNHSSRRAVRDLMYGAGLFEVMTYSFVSADQLEQLDYKLENHLKLKNPLSSEQAYLRGGLLPSHLAVLSRNRNYSKELGFYEISKIFVKKARDQQPDEPLQLAVTMARPEDSFSHVKGILDALARELNVTLRIEPKDRSTFASGRSGVIELNGNVVGWIGQVHPERVSGLKVDGQVAYLELNLGALLDASSARRFAGVQRFPTIQRDLAVLLPIDVTWQNILDATGPYAPNFVGEYYGSELPEGYKSLTMRLVTSNADRTPTEAEAVELEARILGLLERKVGAKPRE